MLITYFLFITDRCPSSLVALISRFALRNVGKSHAAKIGTKEHSAETGAETCTLPSARYCLPLSLLHKFLMDKIQFAHAICPAVLSSVARPLEELCCVFIEKLMIVISAV